ncbi:hypothetical protein GCM10028806_33330 [Spirosoma terrae]|uniref:WDGH domain-containing protein n=1 Tax=Spirosoma terrae TaxID=1968276 RepID=A0A6L9LB25_9BACT|nr:hypothetical protein [Spirosoma terrae]NDU95648.1 hypothetical protein [Spirosoma terrae]
MASTERLAELGIATSGEEFVNTLIKDAGKAGILNVGQVSDGYHTFDELYEHRNLLWVLACTLAQQQWQVVRTDKQRINKGTDMPEHLVWKTRVHADGTPSYPDWFVLGWGSQASTMITYHLPDKLWDFCPFVELDRVPIFDGHTSTDVLDRITNILQDL